MHVGLAFDHQTDPQDERQAEFDPPATVDALQRALEAQGHHVSRLGSHTAFLSGPGCFCDVDLVFNIAEGQGSRNREAWVPTLLDLYNIPYVGSDPLALTLGLDKSMAKSHALILLRNKIFG